MERKFNTNLRVLRKNNKLTLEGLGNVLKISKSTLSDYENGKTFPPLDVCETISNFFGISLDHLQNSDFSEILSHQSLESFLSSQHIPSVASLPEDFSSYKKQLEFQNKLLHQQVEGLQIQLQLVKQLVESKASEIKSLQIQVRLLEEKLKG